MTILDHGVSSKSKEDGTQSRQANLENPNRKQRSRTGHSVRDRGPGHSRSGQVNPAVGVDYSYWTDPAVSHRSADPHFEQEASSHMQLQHEELNIRGHIKPRGLSKSNAVVATKTENQTVVDESGPVESAHPLPVSPALSPTSDVPSSSYSAKSIARLIKKGSEKKISHKKKHRRGLPHQHSGKVVKCPVKTKAQVHRAKVTHLKPPECMLTSAEASSSVTHTFVSPTLLNTDNQFHGNTEASNRYCQFQSKPAEFLSSSLTADQYQTRHLPSASRKSPNMVDGERRIPEVDSFEKDTVDGESEAKNNSDDEYDQARMKRLHRGVDFTKLEQEFAEELKKTRGFVIKAMEEDGACLFRAVADQVYGDQEMHDEVRKNCMNYMTKNSDYYSNYVTEDFSMYIARKRELHTHGNHLEMQAMAELYNRPFEVYQYSTEPINTFQTSHASANPPVRVSYHRNSHYNSVIDPYVATVGVGLGLPSFNPGLVDDNMVKAAVKASCEVWEQQMLNDKVQATDWESTDDAILEQVARESYMEYIEEKSSEIQEVKPEVCDVKKSPERNASGEQCSTRASPSKIVKEFPKKMNRASNSTPSDWVAEEDEWQVLSQVLANSQQEYMDALKHQATHSKATCSKYM